MKAKRSNLYLPLEVIAKADRMAASVKRQRVRACSRSEVIAYLVKSAKFAEVVKAMCEEER